MKEGPHIKSQRVRKVQYLNHTLGLTSSTRGLVILPLTYTITYRLGSGEYEYSDEDETDSHLHREYNITKEPEDKENHTTVKESEEESEEADHNYVSSGDLEADKAAREERLSQDEYNGEEEQEEK